MTHLGFELGRERVLVGVGCRGLVERGVGRDGELGDVVLEGAEGGLDGRVELRLCLERRCGVHREHRNGRRGRLARPRREDRVIRRKRRHGERAALAAVAALREAARRQLGPRRVVRLEEHLLDGRRAALERRGDAAAARERVAGRRPLEQRRAELKCRVLAGDALDDARSRVALCVDVELDEAHRDAGASGAPLASSSAGAAAAPSVDDARRRGSHSSCERGAESFFLNRAGSHRV